LLVHECDPFAMRMRDVNTGPAAPADERPRS
jgi:hypothetical protein